MPGHNLISPAQLARLLGTPDAPVVIDVRPAPEVTAVIPAARRAPFDSFDPAAHAGRSAVVCCTRGKKLSEGAAALLRAHGTQAEVLDGGIAAWQAAELPLIPVAALPAGHLWVTRHRPKIDRIACPWLIRRFVDPAARFLFVAPSEVAAVAQHFSAIPFDIEGVPWSHRGDRCTFDTMVQEWNLSTPALDRLAAVVRAADTDRHDLAPQAAGLLAVSVGLSRLYRDDLEQLEAGMGVYDALYRWARDGFEEGHDWPAGRRE
jgi:rhodanese-related sulfurtransferase